MGMIRLGKVYHVIRCDCCGKFPLSHTVEFRNKHGESLFLGSTCAIQFEAGIMGKPIVKQPKSAKNQLSLL